MCVLIHGIFAVRKISNVHNQSGSMYTIRVWRLALYRVHVKFLDVFQEWVPHTNTRKVVIWIYVCPQTGTPQQGFELCPLDFLSVETIKSPSVLSSN